MPFAAPARAETAISLSAASDDRFRGDSTSGERPVATATLSYDDVRGPYAGVSGTLVVTRHDGLQPLRAIVYGGYAHRLASGLTLDVGISRRDYSHYFTGEYGHHFVELYAGVSTSRWSSHVYYAPDYDGHSGSASYAELNALLLAKGDWSVTGHAGILAPPREPDARHGPGPEADWRIGATRRVGRFGVSLNWVGATRSHDTHRWRGGLVLAVSRSF